MVDILTNKRYMSFKHNTTGTMNFFRTEFDFDI